MSSGDTSIHTLCGKCVLLLHHMAIQCRAVSHIHNSLARSTLVACVLLLLCGSDSIFDQLRECPILLDLVLMCCSWG